MSRVISINNHQRGSLIVFEGLDRAGKSTQVARLLQILSHYNIKAEKLVFPDRTTACGQLINDYLTKRIELPLQAVHMLFSVNRWEFKDKIYELLNKDITLIVDRYVASGAAYNAATTGKPLKECLVFDYGLPKPDLVIFLDVSEDVQKARADWGAERFERIDTQNKVRKNFHELSNTENWFTVDADQIADRVHEEILKQVLVIIDKCKLKPIDQL